MRLPFGDASGRAAIAATLAVGIAFDDSLVATGAASCVATRSADVEDGSAWLVGAAGAASDFVTASDEWLMALLPARMVSALAIFLCPSREAGSAQAAW